MSDTFTTDVAGVSQEYTRDNFIAECDALGIASGDGRNSMPNLGLTVARAVARNACNITPDRAKGAAFDADIVSAWDAYVHGEGTKNAAERSDGAVKAAKSKLQAIGDAAKFRPDYAMIVLSRIPDVVSTMPKGMAMPIFDCFAKVSREQLKMTAGAVPTDAQLAAWCSKPDRTAPDLLKKLAKLRDQVLRFVDVGSDLHVDAEEQIVSLRDAANAIDHAIGFDKREYERLKAEEAERNNATKEAAEKARLAAQAEADRLAAEKLTAEDREAAE